MEAEIISLAHCCQKLFNVVNINEYLGKAVCLLVRVKSIKVSVRDYNDGALTLAKTLPPTFTPRIKYYSTKTIWFREYINKRNIVLFNIVTVDHLGDLFTKGLPRATFENLRNKVMGW